MDCVRLSTGKVHRVSTIIRNSKHRPIMGKTRCKHGWRVPEDEFGVKLQDDSDLCKRCFREEKDNV